MAATSSPASLLFLLRHFLFFCCCVDWLHGAPAPTDNADDDADAAAVDVLVAPKDASLVDADAQWRRLVACEGGHFVRGYRVWQDDIHGDGKGLTRVAFACQAPLPPASRPPPKWIYSGIADQGKPVNELAPYFCPHAEQWIVGVRGVFGGASYGAVSLKVICDAVGWPSSSSSARPTESSHEDTIPFYAPENPARTNTWEETRDFRCPPRHVVCGLNTRVDDGDCESGNVAGIIASFFASFVTDESGVNEIKIRCCRYTSSSS